MKRLKLLLWCPIVEPKLILLYKKGKRFSFNPIVLSQDLFYMVPEVFNTVDMVPFLSK